MLAGVGGRTIAEAKQAMPWDEFQAWMRYRDKHGPLSNGQRIVHAAALVAHTVSSTVPRTKGAKPPKFTDFLLYEQAKQPAKEGPIDLQTAMATWR